MSNTEVSEDGNADLDKSDQELLNLVKEKDTWKALTSSIPNSSMPLLIVSALATFSAAMVFMSISRGVIDAISLNLSYIVIAVFGFYALFATQAILEAYWRWKSSEREIKDVYSMKRMIVEAYISSNSNLDTEAVAALIQLTQGRVRASTRREKNDERR